MPGSNRTCELLDYAEAIYDFAGHAYQEDEYQSSRSTPKAPKLFYAQRGLCPFCRKRTEVVFERRLVEHDPANMSFGRNERTSVWSCSRCGWWEIEAYGHAGSELSGASEGTSLYHGSLCSFAVDDEALPISTLRRHLSRHPEVLHALHPRKFEELVQSIFKDFFQCEVHHVGGPRDGGVDLVVVQADQPFVVQVKRRARRDAAESVSTVRHFLGAMLLQGQSRGTIVTTACKFSTAATASASQAVAMNLVERLDLIDLRRVLELLSLVQDKLEAFEPWIVYVREVVHPRPQEPRTLAEVRDVLQQLHQSQRRLKPNERARTEGAAD